MVINIKSNINLIKSTKIDGLYKIKIPGLFVDISKIIIGGRNNIDGAVRDSYAYGDKIRGVSISNNIGNLATYNIISLKK